MLHEAADAGATDASLINASSGAPARSRSCAAVACMDRQGVAALRLSAAGHTRDHASPAMCLSPPSSSVHPHAGA